ncbi:Cytosolic sulfotransferase 1 [Raphanus sativus]|uniref:Sulfotransferase n=1 Tax=Raphanus sativus TaxID=3726 RepID=A0A6J0NC36_RAPSA|nr:cytosolic sulfotransferase 1-like [Raphanus sativus]XP_056856565.1 cytosolic sulfotransferase 1-like [Raphanus sativus]XP_056857966.1 cytosolic sulfotransferase 1-like [Raphanus sativus]KAJ4866101.1 Cytosolic sulfotransferase 1 [Raphanus sativus]KAJ4867443.1 Cytosolic sulfotransferase 1 [Raphanus sativus]KAJ4904530.1 Cytosolic sulfotransferase 1 [Raphanus sativus]
MNEKELPEQLRDDNLSEETKTLISSLPSTKDFIGKLYNYQGCWYYPNTLQGVLNFQKGFKPQETDIIIASYPKSGTTWLKALTVALLERLKDISSSDALHPLQSDNPHGIVPFLEFGLYLKSSTPDLTKFSSPRLFSTHMPLHTLQIPFEDSPCKIVYVCRDVKDVLVSQWYFRCAYLQKELDKRLLESLFESLCNGVGYFGPFWEHVLSYWRGSLEYPKHVLFMRYEEMKSDPAVQVKRLAEFLGCPFTEEEEEEESGSVDKILELCSLRSLSSMEINKTGSKYDVHHSNYFRKGEVGDSKNHLTHEMENKINMIIEEKYKGSGFKY